MNKKILIISLVYYPEFVGGAEVAVKEITDRSSSGSFDMITLIGSQKERVATLGAVRVFRVGFRVNNQKLLGKALFNLQKYLFPFFVFIKGVSLMKENKYDIVWSIMANYAGFGALFLKLRFPSVKFILTLQEGDPIKYIKRRVSFLYPLFKLIFLRADRVCAISNYLAEFALSMGAKKNNVIPNGVDTKIFSNEFTEEEAMNLKNILNIKEDDVVLVTTSRLVKKNGIMDVIDSFTYLPKKYKFLIIGSGELDGVLKKRVSELGFKDRIIFLGFISHKDIPKYFSISDIFIRTSLSEGMGNSFIEAMHFGLPVVATPVGGIKDFIFNEETGIFVKPKDCISISNNILRLRDKNLYEKIKKNAKIESLKYDWNIISEKYKKVFENI